MNWRYVDENRIGDHICYYSDLRKMQAALSGLEASPRPCRMIFEEIAASWTDRLPRRRR